MTGDSTTAGFVAPISPPSPTPLESVDLGDFLQAIVVGITGLPGNLVVQRWQAEPPNIPPAATAWCAVGVGDSEYDTFAYVAHIDPTTDASGGYDQMQRDQVFDYLCSFYDLGIGGLAGSYAGLLRDGLQIGQNRDAFRAGGVAFVSSGPIINAPVLLKGRWQNRRDITLKLRRRLVRDYAVRSLVRADIAVVTDTGLVAP